jgi:hypothetical protein
VTMKIRKAFLEIVRGREAKYEKWLSFVND